jgi:hypothetical protein
MDRVRIERVVQSVDFLTQDIPGRVRRSIRRELRANLWAAASRAGASEAIRQLGSLRQLAEGYLAAEYGGGRRRPRWMSGFLWAILCVILISAINIVNFVAFTAGVQAARPAADGAFTERVSPWVMGTVKVTYTHGTLHSLAVSLPELMLVYCVAALILGGRLWRLVPGRRAAPQG